MKKELFRILKNRFKNDYGITLELHDNKLGIKQEDFFKTLDLIMLSRCADDFCKNDLQDYRHNINAIHIDNILDEFLTLTGGPDEEYQKAYDLDRYESLILITNNTDKMLNMLYETLVNLETAECTTR